MKHYVKRLMYKLGLTAYKKLSFKNFPPGFDFAVDVIRLTQKSPIETIFDVGANIGQTALSFSKYFDQAHIFAFEPVQETFIELQRNISHLPRVNSFNYGFGSKDCTQPIYLGDNSQLHSLVEGITANPSLAEMITIKTIDKFCDENKIEKIDLLKTDTEGFDLEVVKGAKNYLSSGNIKLILSEVGFKPSDRRHTYFLELHQYLLTQAFRFYALYDLVHHGKRNSGLYYCNALFVNSNWVT